MNDRLRKRIRDFNRKAEAARRNGYCVIQGWVCEQPDPFKHTERICKVDDYDEHRAASNNPGSHD